MRTALQVKNYLKEHFPLAIMVLKWPFLLGWRRKLVFSAQSRIQKIRVSQKGALRSLQLGEGDTPIQTCISLKNPQVLILGCSHLMLASLYLSTNPRKILILGLGGGVLARTLAHLLPESTITNVEIDPLVAEVAKTYFYFSPNCQQHIIIDDGRRFIESAAIDNKQYDLIMLDAYNATYIPNRLMTLEFLQSVKKLLAPQGVLAANTFSASTLYDRESATYAAVFGDFYNLKFNNRIILTKKDGLPTLATINKHAKAMEQHFNNLGINTRWLANLFTTSYDQNRSALPLIDKHLIHQ